MADLAAAQADLAAPDLATGDLAMPDLVPPPMLTGLPECAAANVDAVAVYNQVALNNCMARYCHGPSDPVSNFSFDSPARMRMVWVGRGSRQSGMPFITPNNVHRSYVLWKLLGEQDRLGPVEMTGARMPLAPRAPLSDAALCLVVNWIRSGAN